MEMTDTLLIIIAVLLAVRIVLQLMPGKRAFEKMYQATSEVKNVHIMVSKHDIVGTNRRAVLIGDMEHRAGQRLLAGALLEDGQGAVTLVPEGQ